jgi:hypothetical protein
LRISSTHALLICYFFLNLKPLTLPSAGAQSIRVVTLAFPDPSGPSSAGEPHRINSTLSFDFSLQQNIRTLSTSGAVAGNDITGLLYTPDLAHDDPCYNASLPYVPANATRPSNFPNNARYSLVALAPWISPTCTLTYLAAAHELQTYSFLFFMTDDNNEAPPQSNDAYWNVGDNGKWKEEYNFPVYVLPGASGATLINATADYSGNLSSVPNAKQLLETEDPTDFVRLYVDIDTGESNSQFPGTSIFSFSCVLYSTRTALHAKAVLSWLRCILLRCTSLCIKHSFCKMFLRLTYSKRLWYPLTQLVGLPPGRFGNSTDYHRRHVNTHALGPEKTTPTAAPARCYW